MNVVYDAGVLIKAEASTREVWAEHRVRLEAGVVPVTTAPVVAQVSRAPRQVQLRRLLRGCQVEAFPGEQAHQVGALLAKTGASDVVDAHVALVASGRRARILTSDPSDLKRLAKELSPRPEVGSV
jgi:hypothetical protein